jgi:ribosome-associated protein
MSEPAKTTGNSGPDSAAAASDNPMVAPTRSIRPHGIEYSRKLAAAAVRVALDNKGQDVMVLDVCGQSAEFDLFVLVTGTSRRQLHAISEQIDDALEKELGDQRMGIEGYQESRWIVLDYGSIVIHLFDEETREFYDLESLWADGKVVPLEDLGVSDPA